MRSSIMPLLSLSQGNCLFLLLTKVMEQVSIPAIVYKPFRYERSENDNNLSLLISSVTVDGALTQRGDIPFDV